MMRKLLLFFAMLCVSIGTWAQPGSEYKVEYNQGTSAGTETVLKIKIGQTDHLKDAIAAAQNSGNSFQYLLLETEPANATVTLSSEDIAALNGLNVNTINLTKAKLTDFTLNNANVSYIILPYDLTKEQVKTVGETHKNNEKFKACLSTSNTPVRPDNSGDDATLIAYLGQADNMADALRHTYFTENNNNLNDPATLGNKAHDGNVDCSRLRYLTVMGNFCARDISSEGIYDANGHYVTQGVPDENTTTFNVNTSGEPYYIGVTTGGGAASGTTPGALQAYTKNLYVLDLKDAYVPDNYAADIVFPYSLMGGSNLREIWMPEDSRFNTVPADYLNISCNVRQICIPGNIKYIKTRAFAGTSGTGRMCYIWTTGPDASVKYDNGAAFVNGDETTWKYMNNAGEGNVAMTASDYNQFQYGTFTLPAGLELIERFAFSQSTSVSDVYVLNPVAPECHVDAFNCTMYLANNTLQPKYIKDGIVTREAYRNDESGTEYKFVTILHYPRETTDPNIQRYTDPTREYSIATGERDGNGSTIYYPNHSEMTYAYYQGSYGYLWKGWDDSRNWYDQSLKAGYGEGLPATESSHHPDRAGAQATANQRWIDNEYNADQKADRSFYDVTTGGNNQPGETAAPSGLTPYYENRYSGYDGVLYPQMETNTTSEIIGQRQAVDENGNPRFEPGDCEYVKDYRYVKDDEGGFVQVATVTGYEGTQSSVDGVSTYYSDNQGKNPATPKVQDGYFVEDGKKDVYTAVDKNNDAIGAKDQYYTKNGDTYTPSDLMFNNICYYYSEEGEMKGWVQEWGYENPNANHYTSKDLTGTPIKAGDDGFGYNTMYWVYYTDVIHYIASDHFIPGKTWYSYDQNNKTYTQITLSWHNPITGDYYYKSGQEPNYVSANGQDYNPSTTYYQNGTVVSTVNFDNTYYIPTYDYSYEAYTGQEGDRYKQEEYYREGTSEELADPTVERYCPVMENVYAVVKGKQNDYRGWHQFILTGRSYDYIVPMEPLRSFISDNDWWTICVPYDLRYNDMVKFFGTDRQGFDKKIPYLSKLMYVVRDVENQKITLMFSKNLMQYKEQFLDANTQQGKQTAKRVHGLVNDQVEWTPEELAEDPIILHAGVPYLIKPDMMVDNTTGKYKRQFDIFKSATSDLYERLHESEELSGSEQMDLVYAGEYTVPAYVVGYDAADAASEGLDEDGELVITMKDGTTITYQDSKKDAANKITYKGKEVSYRISDDFKYTFVGSFYKSVMPQYCYFLGWDSKANRAAFWYSAVQDKSGWNWNNETGIICPNFDTDTEIHKATKVEDPARWTITNASGVSSLSSDDFPAGTGVGGAKSYTMDFGATNYFEWDEATGVSEMVVKPLFEETKVYDANGRYMGSSLQNLPKGVYIVNGKKYVVK